MSLSFKVVPLAWRNHAAEACQHPLTATLYIQLQRTFQTQQYLEVVMRMAPL